MTIIVFQHSFFEHLECVLHELLGQLVIVRFLSLCSLIQEAKCGISATPPISRDSAQRMAIILIGPAFRLVV